jgi:anti-anti-sigma regulatory factor
MREISNLHGYCTNLRVIEVRRIVMARRSRVFAHRNSENIHLKLVGDFDESTAHELLALLRRYAPHASRAFIHTSCLSKIDPFAVRIFHYNLDFLRSMALELVFTGQNARPLIPDNPPFIGLTMSTIASVTNSGATLLVLSSASSC